MAKEKKNKFNNKNKIKAKEQSLALTDSRWYTSPFFVLGIVLIVMALAFSKLMAYDSDQLFMIASGRDIIKNGISHTNNMTWLKDLEIVVQQWLYAVIFAFVHDCVGKFSGIVMCTVNLILLFIPMYKTARLKNDQGKSFFITGLMLLCMPYVIGPRPTVLTAALLVWQIYVCEAKKNMWWIPLLVLLESNLHSAYIIFHFVYLLPYIVPGVTKYLVDEHDFKYAKIIPAMIIAAFCNPYGIKGTLYLFYSYQDVKKMKISELRVFDLSEYRVVIPIIVFLIVAVAVAYKLKEKLPSPAFYIFIGTVAMLIISPVNKNIFFIAIGILPITVFLFKDVVRKKNFIIELLLSIILSVIVIVTIVPDRINDFDNLYPSKTIEYLREVKPKRLYTCFDAGALVEIVGMKCFIDARPELFLKKINDKYDYLYDADTVINGTNEEINDLSKKYKFDYYFIDKVCNITFSKWAANNCQLIMEEKGYFLYKKL